MTEDYRSCPNLLLESTEEAESPETLRTINMATGEVMYTQLNQRDTSEIEALFHNHFRKLGRLAFLLTNDLQEAEDVVADVFLKLTERYDTQKLDNPIAFLRASVVNNSISVLRHRKVKDKMLPKLAPGASGDSTYDSAVSATDSSAIVRALQQLTIRQRQVIVLRYYADLDERETAEIMGLRIGSVKSHSARGFAALRHILGPHIEEFR